MKGVGTWLSGIALIAAITFLAIAPGVHARPSSEFQMKLPFDAAWGQIALPTGDYWLSIDQFSANGRIFLYHGNQAVGIAHPQTFDGTETQGNEPKLICLRHDGKVSVRSLHVPGVGTFYFSLPKDLNKLLTQQPRSVETITVEMNVN
jgi:hypothetical protein